MSKIIDISQTLRQGMPVWPGDTEFQRFWIMQMEKGDSCNVGSVTMSLHTGTHVDSPKHFLKDGKSTVEMDLSAFIGSAIVIDLSGEKTITKEHIAKYKNKSIKRILFKTMSASVDSFNDDFTYLEPNSAVSISELNVKLVGIDTPSVDKVDSKTMESHKILAEHNIAILENIILDHVQEGEYQLIAFPLKLADMDASPVRAVLMTLD